LLRRFRFEKTATWAYCYAHGPQLEYLVNTGNVSDEEGNLVFEVVSKFGVTPKRMQNHHALRPITHP
jgi:hypothetical protein